MFSEILTTFKAKLKTIIADSKELSFPYDLETLNKDDNLSVGFGIVIGSSSVEGYYFHRRNISIVLTRRFKQGARETKETELIDEAHNIAYSLKEALVGCSKVTDLVVLGDDGISYFEDNKYLQTTLNLELFYQEF